MTLIKIDKTDTELIFNLTCLYTGNEVDIIYNELHGDLNLVLGSFMMKENIQMVIYELITTIPGNYTVYSKGGNSLEKRV